MELSGFHWLQEKWICYDCSPEWLRFLLQVTGGWEKTGILWFVCYQAVIVRHLNERFDFVHYVRDDPDFPFRENHGRLVEYWTGTHFMQVEPLGKSVNARS
jgi:hypothetical protein